VSLEVFGKVLKCSLYRFLFGIPVPSRVMTKYGNESHILGS